MEGIEHPGRPGHGISCPLCGHTYVHYLKKTDTWVCGHCDYTWHFIEHCTNRRHPGN